MSFIPVFFSSHEGIALIIRDKKNKVNNNNDNDNKNKIVVEIVMVLVTSEPANKTTDE